MLNMKEIHDASGKGGEIGTYINEILQDRLDVLWVHDYVLADETNTLFNMFKKSEAKKSRGDNVPGEMVGVSHYFKKPDEYFAQCDRTRQDVQKIFNTTNNPIENIYSHLSESTQRIVRPSMYNGIDSLPTRAMQWEMKKESDFLLAPHDDVSQVFCPRNEGWEIQNVSTLVAVNFYIKCTEGQGMLRLFDLKHSSELEEKAQVQGAGYPYPDSILDGLNYVDIAVKSGDIIFLNGAYIHGVMPSKDDRLIMNSFLGQLQKSDEIIYWT